MMTFKYSITGFVLFLLCSATALAQVSISPTSVFLDRGTGVGTMFLSNPSDAPLEVQISFEFAYPQTNEQGEIEMNYDDEEARERFSLEPFLRAFPTTFILQPNERQTVRLIGRIPSDRDDGMYWTRMRISSSQLTPPVGDATEGGIRAQVAFQINQITAVFGTKGAVETGVTIHGSERYEDSEPGRLVVLTHAERTGNAPFLGRIYSQLVNANGTVVAENQSTGTVYFENRHRTEFDISSLPSGTYTVRTTFETQRSDVSSRHLVQAPPVSSELTVQID
ncbi:MAG: hypothetical protein ACNA78_03000 [Balneolaceae bacterium]